MEIQTTSRRESMARVNEQRHRVPGAGPQRRRSAADSIELIGALPWPMRLSELQALTPKLQVIAERYGASNLAVFGSVARDEATAASDVDLLVDLPSGTSLFQRAELKQDLEGLLQHNVDLIRRRNLRPDLRERVEAEAVPLA